MTIPEEIEKHIVQGINGLSVLDADKALDTLRRLVWANAFTGIELTNARGDLKDDALMNVARELVTLPMAEVACVLESVRLMIWKNGKPESNPHTVRGPNPNRIGALTCIGEFKNERRKYHCRHSSQGGWLRPGR
ncbi:MAG TPA: hypothetical protein ENI69_02475 [Rhodospirillales bacterium]|nr:hypothetical protein [Rhodospirillales bacterium]